MHGISHGINPRKRLVKVAARDHIITFFVLCLKQFRELLCLRDLSRAVIVGLQVQINEHQFLFTARDRHSAHEQTAFEICDAERPRERHRKRNARLFCRLYGGKRQQSRFDPADGIRNRVWHIGANIIRRKRCAVSADGCEHFRLIDAPAALCIPIDLLQEQKVALLRFKDGTNACKVLFNNGGITRRGLFAAVHEKIGFFAKARVPRIEREKGIRRCRHRAFKIRAPRSHRLCRLLRIRAELHSREIGNERSCQQDDGEYDRDQQPQYERQSPFGLCLHSFVPPLCPLHSYPLCSNAKRPYLFKDRTLRRNVGTNMTVRFRSFLFCSSLVAAAAAPVIPDPAA